ncbi:MAG TPA: energy transducer TonB [Caulobacteraceae bacterium]
MTAFAVRRRDNLSPALMAAAALHLGAFALIAMAVRTPPPAPLGDAVPITLVAGPPQAEAQAAQTAPTAQAAAVDNPVPDASPPEPPPPSKPAPAPRAAPSPALARPTPARSMPVASPTPAAHSFSLDALEARIAVDSHAVAHRALASRGPTRVATAPPSRATAGPGVSQSDLQGLQGLLERLWNPNCAVEGGGAVTVSVRFRVDVDGRVEGRVTGGGEESSGNPVVMAAARRAIDAVHEAEPYAAPYRGQDFEVTFNAKKACSES